MMDKVIKIAEGELGYLEKKSNKSLDDKTANAGSANFTKYGAYFSMNPAQWCDLFVDWCFCQAYGRTKAKELLCGNFSAYTPTSAQLFKNKKQWHTTPKKGDVIFFKNSQRICHTGIVYKVDNTYVYTIEGNTSGGSAVISNGGGCCKKKYLLTNSRIAGYGRPKYDGSTTAETVIKNEGAKTVNITLNQLSKGSKGKQVETLQHLLVASGLSVGKYGADGDFGNATLDAVKAFQKKKGLTADGIVGAKTWEKLLK